MALLIRPDHPGQQVLYRLNLTCRELDNYSPNPKNGFVCIPYKIKAVLASATGEPPESSNEGEPSKSTGVPKRGPFVEGEPTASASTKTFLIHLTESEEAVDRLEEIYYGGDGHFEGQEGVGDSHCPRQGTTHECCYDVHVGQQPANLQHHDGLHAVQESDTKPDANEPSLHEVRDGGDKKDNLAD